MSQFGDLYSKYYDLLYQDKDYNAEVDYIIQLIQKYPNKIETILDLGCGTGKHDKILCDKGYTIHGVDISEEMLNIAELRRKGRESELTFSQSDIAQLELGKKFDAIVSLFHVMSYQNTNDLLDRVFSVAINHLNKGGLFIFDFWYGPAVLADPPRKKIKKLENETIQITRISETQMLAHLNRVDVSFNISAKNIKENTEFKKKRTPSNEIFF